jgi:hypothetical protein
MAGQDPLYAYQRDLDVIQLLDRLGYDEVCTTPPAAR